MMTAEKFLACARNFFAAILMIGSILYVDAAGAQTYTYTATLNAVDSSCTGQTTVYTAVLVPYTPLPIADYCGEDDGNYQFTSVSFLGETLYEGSDIPLPAPGVNCASLTIGSNNQVTQAAGAIKSFWDDEASFGYNTEPSSATVNSPGNAPCPSWYFSGNGIWNFTPNPNNLGSAAQVNDPSNTANSDAPESDPNTCTNGCTFTGEPVNALTGNEFETQVDFAGAGNTGLSLTRYYNSQDNTSSVFGFGTGWHASWHRGMNINGYIFTVTRADGRQDVFTQQSSGSFTANPNVTSKLIAVTSGGTVTGYKLTLKDDTVESYDTYGTLLSVTTRAGLVTTLTYNPSGELTTVTGPFGQQLTFTYTPELQVYKMTVPNGGVYTYAYDYNNNLTSVTYPDSTTRQYVYGNTSFPNALTGIVDENGITYATIAYDAQQRAITTQLAGTVNTTNFAYNADGTSTVTDANGYAHTFGYTTEFGIMQTTSLTGAPVPRVGGSAFSYDANGFLASKTDFNGNVTTFTHDVNGNETSRVEAYGTSVARTITTTWNASFHLPATIAEPNRTTTFTYDGNGNLLTRSVSNGTLTSTWTYTYNGYSQVLTVKDPDNNTTTLTYNSNGTLATATDALSHTTSFTSYDANQRLLSMTDPNGLVISFTYDGRGRVKTYTRGSLTTTYTYDNAGNLTKVTRPDSTYTSFTYDNAHRLTGIGDVVGNSITYTLDPASNVTQVQAKNSGGTVTQTHGFTYDSVNRILHSIGALSQYTAYAYDPQGNVTGVTDPLNHSYTYTFDQLNRVATITDPNSGTTTHDYDANDHVTSIEDPRSLTTSYSWNGMNQVTPIDSPDTGSTSYTYDNYNNILTKTDARGDVSTYTYDALNRDKTASYTGGASATYTYDTGTYGKGHLTGLSDSTGSTSWTYDIYGRVTQKTQITGSVTQITNYSYDAYGRLSTITYPSGNVITYGYDTDGRVSTVSKGALNLLSSITYMPFGQVSGWTEGSTATYARTIDKDGRITTITISGTPSVPGTTTLNYTYDNADRITQVTGFTAPSLTAGTLTSSISSSSNKLNSVGGTSYTYDANGNMTGDGTHTWVYDQRGRMSSSITGGVTTTYAVNDLGERVKKTGTGVPSGGTNEFVYDEKGHMLGEYGSTGTIIEETVWLGNIPVAVMTSSGSYQIDPNNINAPQIITNQTGNPVWTWTSLDFGGNAPNQNPSGLGTFSYNLRFPGQYYDAETGLSYNMMRDYNPTLGRYVESDPIGLAGGQVSTYAYADGNPISETDQSGLYGTESCSFWQQACEAGGGQGVYACHAAQFVCPNTPDSKWTQCVRQCLQDKYQNEMPSGQCSTSNSVPPGQITADHLACWSACHASPDNPLDSNPNMSLPNGNPSLF